MFKSICLFILSAFAVTVGILISFMFLGCEDLGKGIDAGKLDAESLKMENKQTAADLATKAVLSTSGKYVKVVGATYDKEAIPLKTSTADVVPVSSTESATCNVVFLSKKVNKLPDALKDHMGAASIPVELPGSCDANQNCVWNALLTGDNCKFAADLPGYLGSTYEELASLPTATQARFMKVSGTCTMKDKDNVEKQVDCTVPVGDPKAKINAEPFFPHAWSNRDDLNQIKAPVKVETLEDPIP